MAPALADAISPPRQWRAIGLATLLLAPAVWALLIGLVAAAADGDREVPAAPPIALGLLLIPVAFAVLALASRHPDAPGAVARAVGLLLLVGIPVSALAGDAVTGVVAGVGAGGIVSLRADPTHDWRWRAASVAIGAAYCFALARAGGAMAVVAAPIFPFTGLGLADHLADWRRQRAHAVHEPVPPPLRE